MIVLVGNTHQVGKIPGLIKIFLIIVLVRDDLINVRIEMQVIRIQFIIITSIQQNLF